MRQSILYMCFTMLISIPLIGQNIVKGIVIDGQSKKTIPGVLISFKDSSINTLTNLDGSFELQRFPIGNKLLTIRKERYVTKTINLEIKNGEINLKKILLFIDQAYEEQDFSTIVITDHELNNDSSSADNISGLLQASRDVYIRTAAFEWSSSFFKIRGLDSENGKVLINGVEMNKLYNGRAQWSNWGGLNDVLRNQEFNNGLSPSNYTFGGVLGSTNINTRASDYRQGGRISYSSSNRSYINRIMVSYSSGLLENGWAYTVSGSRRDGNQGYIDGTLYDANSIFASIEKKINDNHSINFTSIYAQNKRGKSAPITQQVYDIKGIRYNPYWGFQNGKMRNSRIKRIEEPILMLNHYWEINDNTQLNTNIAYQFGEIGNSRLDFNGGNDPNPTYYRKLPNWYLNNRNGADYANAYKALQNFKNNGQLNWTDLYAGNQNSGDDGRFALYEDRNDDKQLTISTILNSNLNDNIILNGSFEYRKLHSENFAYIKDLLGATGYLDINKFGSIGKDDYQNDLLNPNRIVRKGERFKYNYDLESEIYGGFGQLQFKYNKVDFYLSGNISNTSHQRNGKYKNGLFPGSKFDSKIPNSLGKSKKLFFLNYGLKSGITYKISGRHLLDFNGGYVTKAPSIRNSFANSRSNNLTVKEASNLKSEKIMSLDASYILRTPFIKSKITGYFITIKNATNISFFYTGGNNLFVQEIVTGIDKNHFGLELGAEAKITPTLTLKAATNIGQYTFNNNPNTVLTTEVNDESAIKGFDKRGVKNYGKTYLKNYKVPTGPQQSFSFGFEYRDPNYWFIGITGNYFNDTYINISPLKRTSAFISDDGEPFPNYDPIIAKKLLKQEKFSPFYTLNAIAGKSWKVGKKQYIGVFLSLNNFLNKQYKTGGYEQGRTSNYHIEKADKVNNSPNFGNKYWFGRGATYFLNINYRF